MTHEPDSLKRLMMCRPDHYEVGYAINPWMDPDGWNQDPDGNRRLALKEWQGLKALYESLGATVIEEPGAPGLPDMVFASNAGFALDGKMLLARFREPERQGEEAQNARFFEKCREQGWLKEIEAMPEGLIFEGGGDAVFDSHHKLIWLGYGQRSSPGAADVLERMFGLPVVGLSLISPDFYHLDTALAPLPKGHILYVPRAFDRQTLARIEDIAGDKNLLLPLSEEDSVRFCANAVAIGDHLIMGNCSDRLRARLEDFGYRVHRSELSRFLMGGGSAYCLTCRLDLTSRG